MKRPFDLQQLQCFVTLAETLHFGQAAQRLHMTQSPLSRQISLLEERLNVRLLVRSNRSVSLTPAGTFLLQEARAILHRAGEAAAKTQLAARGEQGTLVIGFTSTAAFDLVPRLVQRHHEQYPGVSFVFKELLIEEQLHMLGEAALDVALVRPPVDSSLFASHLLTTDRWALAMPADHALSALRQVPLRHLDGAPMIAWSPHSRYFHLALERLYAAHGVMPRAIVSMSQITAMLGLVRRGVGLATVPYAVASHAVEGIAIRPLQIARKWAEDAGLQTLLAWRRHEHDATVHRFAETARQCAATP
ncbi:LysR family transcriptional regulator [Bordetella sp. BOR01]|uniref:LysR family transcriptional regulator n=1 Tax=Bordetella sp. BOR01 TaxID=2854779 RepID=UPI001C48B212|nr:LysR substrate-binding domain-containing protein [Bordetella sp. BOR01]MBV7481714.1 LysR family transcriptional regulator [Bordetella sp. BOR01]